MPYDLSDKLVVGVSSTALFDLRKEDRIYTERGLTAFLEVQRTREEDALNPGTAFHLVKKLLSLNSPETKRVEVLLISKNHPDVHFRVFNSIRKYRLGIERIFLNGGEPLDRYLTSYKLDLFLSSSEADVRKAISLGIPAGQILGPPTEEPAESSQIRLAFDGDCVLFNDESQQIADADPSLRQFHENEDLKQRVPLGDGPFAQLVRTIRDMQGDTPEASPFRVGLVTARSAPSHLRTIRTLQEWGLGLITRLSWVDYRKNLGSVRFSHTYSLMTN